MDVFSSAQPNGLMTLLMGENLMRKDGRAHMRERRAIYPSMSPKTVRTIWSEQFAQSADAVLQTLRDQVQADLFWDFAMPVSAHALRHMTGLTNLTAQEMNQVSQGMIDGCANYIGDPEVEAFCRTCTALIDEHIEERLQSLATSPDHSLLSVAQQAGMDKTQIHANIKLAISGGQNEPRDAIAGVIWALVSHPDQLTKVRNGQASWLQAFEEYARWISPIGMSPRRVAQAYDYGGVHFEPEDKVFLMFSSGNRDEAKFAHADEFDIDRDLTGTLSFGAGPHYCAGAWASRALIAGVALPKLFSCVENLEITGEVPFGGWAFRGPLALPCRWQN